MRFFTLIMLLSSQLLLAAQEEKVSTISFGNVSIGEQRIPLSTDDFNVQISSTTIKVAAKLISGSIQWIRSEGVLLTPRARIAIAIKLNPKDIHIRYHGQSLIMQEWKNMAYIEFYTSLFQPDDIDVFLKDKKIGTIRVFAKQKINKTKTHLIDYSCAPYQISIKGMDGEYISVGCRVSRIGKMGKEKPMVEILWTSANYKLQDRSEPPYIAVFLRNHPIIMTVINEQTKQKKEIQITAKIPERMHRLKTALGIGPYGLKAQQSLTETNSSKVSSALMLYGRFDLNEETSFRFFDSYIFESESSFHNYGLYYAYDLTTILDKRLQITALLGFQSVYFRFNSDSPSFSDAIYPQGLEFIYKHPFGLENYSFVFGAFVDTNNFNNYQNLWVRFGKRIFWELNYINWQNDLNQASTMWGLSIGFPFFSAF